MRYQDNVIKDGKFVGKFEEMYEQSTEVPWHQDELAYGIFSDLDITILNHMHKRYDFLNGSGCRLLFRFFYK